MSAPFEVRIAVEQDNAARIIKHSSTAPTSKQAVMEALEVAFATLDAAKAEILSLVVLGGAR